MDDSLTVFILHSPKYVVFFVDHSPNKKSRRRIRSDADSRLSLLQQLAAIQLAEALQDALHLGSARRDGPVLDILVQNVVTCDIRIYIHIYIYIYICIGMYILQVQVRYCFIYIYTQIYDYIYIIIHRDGEVSVCS